MLQTISKHQFIDVITTWGINIRITVLKSKIAYAKITKKDLFYVGSITIDEEIMEQVNIRENEKVQVVNLNNGERLETYVIKGKRGSKVFGLNGPAARKAEVGDKVFIISYAEIDAKDTLTPKIVDLEHDIIHNLEYDLIDA